MDEDIKRAEIAGHPLLYYDELDSTNRLARDLGLKGQKSGTIVVAGDQSKGRGRLGKSWYSAPGSGLYFSMILRPRLPLAEMARITLSAGLALALAVDRFTGQAAKLKWPNDLFLAGQKCGGILTETEVHGGAALVILGVGVNVREPEQGFPADIRERAGALSQFCHDPQRGDLLRAIVRELDQLLPRLEGGQWPAIRREWQERDVTKGRSCTWLTAAGELITGIGEGIDDEGQLHIRDGNGRSHPVLSGDVQLQIDNACRWDGGL
ncbi:MAG: biotin--[acetyl-CoA-carboxylase] ligase [Thermodesulfobacteriota bacterium]